MRCTYFLSKIFVTAQYNRGHRRNVDTAKDTLDPLIIVPPLISHTGVLISRPGGVLISRPDFTNFAKLLETLNGHLPLEDGSNRHKTLGKRDPDDLQHFVF